MNHRKFWGAAVVLGYLGIVYLTSMLPEWNKVSIGLLGLGLGWFFTANHYSHKSQQKYFFLGQWWTHQQLEQLNSNNPEMLRRAFPPE
jgi:hypothetical protein